MSTSVLSQLPFAHIVITYKCHIFTSEITLGLFDNQTGANVPIYIDICLFII